MYYLKVYNPTDTSLYGIGECAPLAGLSIDYRPDLEQKIQEVVKLVNEQQVPLDAGRDLPADLLSLEAWPALTFALETALLDLKHGGNRKLYQNSFSQGEAGIPINGLVWMGDIAFMQEQIEKKLKDGYTCLKLKIGSLNFMTELELLQGIREVAGPEALTIRVDANGAFSPQEAFKKLERLAKYELHSIEQPIKQGQWEEMTQLCKYTPVPIALDEELIGAAATAKRRPAEKYKSSVHYT
ncbi:hypothetical protein GCM10028895_09360 [Pontibacter rugosus]